MKALVLRDYKSLAYEEVADPPMASRDVAIRVAACGICGSDVHGYDGSTGRRIPPLIMGHEAAGVIQALGDEARQFEVGERVTFDSTIYCGECWYCRRGEINLCNERRVLGVSCADYRRNGAFADTVVVPERIVHRLPPHVSFEHAAMAEALSVALHAAKRVAPGIQETAVVIGAGMIGLLVIQVLKIAGCGEIVAVDTQPARLA